MAIDTIYAEFINIYDFAKKSSFFVEKAPRKSYISNCGIKNRIQSSILGVFRIRPAKVLG